MKTLKSFLLMLSLLSLHTGIAMANEPPAAAVVGKEHPCHKIRTACEGAGFVRGGHKKDGKGLWKDCVQPVMNGTSIAGVTVDSKDIQACKEKRESRKAKRKAAK